MRPPAHDLPDHRDRVRGCLLGGALGDALGAPVEFESIGRIRRQHGPGGLTGLVPDWRGAVGLITDDTQMTLFTVEGLIRGGDVAAVRRAYLRWLDTQQHRSPLPASPASPAFPANERPTARPARTSSPASPASLPRTTVRRTTPLRPRPATTWSVPACSASRCGSTPAAPPGTPACWAARPPGRRPRPVRRARAGQSRFQGLRNGHALGPLRPGRAESPPRLRPGRRVRPDHPRPPHRLPGRRCLRRHRPLPGGRRARRGGRAPEAGRDARAGRTEGDGPAGDVPLARGDQPGAARRRVPRGGGRPEPGEGRVTGRRVGSPRRRSPSRSTAP